MRIARDLDLGEDNGINWRLSDLSHKVASARQVQDTVAEEMKNIMPALLDRAFSGAL